MSSLKLGPLCLYSTWNNDLMIQDWVSFEHLIHAGYGDYLSVFVSWSQRQINIHWLHLARMAWVNVFTPVLSFSQYSEQLQHQCRLVRCWPVPEMNWWLNDERPRLRVSNLELPLSLVGPFTDDFEKSSLHCVLGTEVPWQLAPERSLCFPLPLYAEWKVSHQLYFHSPQAGDLSLPKFAQRLFPLHKVPFW